MDQRKVESAEKKMARTANQDDRNESR